MEEAIEAYRSVTASPEFRETERLRSKARHDQAQALRNERRKIARNAVQLKLPIEDIVKPMRANARNPCRLGDLNVMD